LSARIALLGHPHHRGKAWPKKQWLWGCPAAWVVRLAAVGYLRGMKLTRTNLWLAAATAMLLTASCAQAPDAAEAEKDPSADAAYKRAHRAEGYREAQRSNVTRN
jgi:hypothetical protein